MTNGTRPPRRTLLVGIAAVALMAGLAGIYVIGGADGNRQQAGACNAAATLAAEIAPLARGEVAAFLPAKAPSQLSDLAFSNDAGAPLTLADFRDRVVLVNLWATWCAPCRKEMPALDQLQAELGSDDFEVVAVSVDQTGEEKPRAFLKEIGVGNLAFYADPTMKIFQDVRARGLPTTLLVDGNGCEIGALMGPAEWASEDAKTLVRAAIDARRKVAPEGPGS